MRKRKFYAYITTNKHNTTFYIGITGNLLERMYQHKNGLAEGFTKRYKLTKLVYYEEFDSAYSAIRREKQLKNWHRDWKINLIKENNSNFEDLSENWLKEMPKQVRHDGKETR